MQTVVRRKRCRRKVLFVVIPEWVAECDFSSVLLRHFELNVRKFPAQFAICWFFEAHPRRIALIVSVLDAGFDSSFDLGMLAAVASLLACAICASSGKAPGIASCEAAAPQSF